MYDVCHSVIADHLSRFLLLRCFSLVCLYVIIDACLEKCLYSSKSDSIFENKILSI